MIVIKQWKKKSHWLKSFSSWSRGSQSLQTILYLMGSTIPLVVLECKWRWRCTLRQNRSLKVPLRAGAKYVPFELLRKKKYRTKKKIHSTQTSHQVKNELLMDEMGLRNNKQFIYLQNVNKFEWIAKSFQQIWRFIEFLQMLIL